MALRFFEPCWIWALVFIVILAPVVFVRAGRHELVHLGAALSGQGDTLLHEIEVQYVTTPENLIIGGTILGGGIGAGVYYSIR